MFAAPGEFGAPLTGVHPDDFTVPARIYQIGVDPVRIAILMDVEGLDFAAAWEHRKDVVLEDLPVHYISFDDLIVTKQAAGRPQDRLDLRRLRKAAGQRGTPPGPRKKRR